MENIGDINQYKEALRRFNKFLLKVKNIVFDKYPDLIEGEDLKSRIKDIDSVQRKIDDMMIQFKKLFTEKLLVLTAMRSLLWHINTTITDSENVKEIKERIRIFIIPEIERFINSFKREISILQQRIQPLFRVYDNIKETVNSYEARNREFNKIVQGEDGSITLLEDMLSLILDGKLEEFDKIYELKISDEEADE